MKRWLVGCIMRQRRRQRDRCFLGAREPVSELDLGRLSTPDCATSRRRLRSTASRVRLTDVPRRRRARRMTWKFSTRTAPASTSTRACPRESGGDGRRLCAPHDERHGQARGPHVQDHDHRSAGLVGVAGIGACTHVAMEATGVYWKPVWHILSDGDFALTLANAAHVKAVPGRKTDINDAHGSDPRQFRPRRRDARATRPAAHPQATGT